MNYLTSLFHWVENTSLTKMILIVVPISIVVTLTYLIISSVFRTFLYHFTNKG